MTATRALPAALAALLLCAGPASATASPAAPLPVSLSAAQGRLVAALDLSAAFGDGALRRLGNGLTNVVAVLVAVIPEAGGEPAAVAGRVVEIRWDVWDEEYTVTWRPDGPGAPGWPGPTPRRAADAAALRRLLSSVAPLDLGPLEGLPEGAFRVEARVELNPVSRELMERTRDLLAHPSAAGRTAGRPGAGARSMLGSVAGYLLRDPSPGGDLTVLRSRPFERAEVTSR